MSTQPMQPEQATFLLHAVALPWLKVEHPLTRKVIEAVPLDKGDYRPNPNSRPAFELAWHIASAENRFLDGVASGEFNYGGSTPPETVRNSADVAKWYAETFERNVGRLEKLSPDQLVKIIDFRGIRQLPAVAYLMSGMATRFTIAGNFRRTSVRWARRFPRFTA